MSMILFQGPTGPVYVNPARVESVTTHEERPGASWVVFGSGGAVLVSSPAAVVAHQLAGSRARRVDPSSSAELTSELLLRSLPDLEGSLEAFGTELVARVDAREGKEWRRWAGSLAELLRDSSRNPDGRLELAGALLDASAMFGPTGLAAHPSHMGALLAVADAARCYLRNRDKATDAACFATLQTACAELDSLELVASFTPGERPEEGGTP